MSLRVDEMPNVTSPIGAIAYAAEDGADRSMVGGSALGFATLDSSGRIPSSQLNLDAMEYKGAWNATTNSPTLANGTGNPGDVYRVSVAGTRNLGAGSDDYDVADLVVYSGTVWEKWDSNDVMTAAGILALLITVDGAASGLDADLLDGQHGAYYAPLASPPLSGNPTTPTQTPGDVSTKIASTAFVRTPGVQAVVSASTVTATAADDLVKVTAHAAALLIDNPTGTWLEGQVVQWRIKDSGSPQAITYGGNIRAIGVTLPTTTVAGKTLYLGAQYNDTDAKWDVFSVAQEA